MIQILRYCGGRLRKACPALVGAAAMLMLMPSVTLALCVICLGGNCQFWPGICKEKNKLGQLKCYDTSAQTAVHLLVIREGDGAAILENGKSIPIISDRADAALAALRATGNPSPKTSASYERELVAIFDFTDRKVSNERFALFTKEVAALRGPLRGAKKP